MNFNGKVALVTGASSGIGAAIAIQFAAAGAKVAIVGRNAEKLKIVAEQCEKNGSKPLVINADVAKDDDAKRIVNDTVRHFEKLDVLVNNAGIGNSASILDENAIQIFDKVMATNLRSAVYITHLAAPHLIETKGNIINISSIAAIAPLGHSVFSYCTSKAGLDHFTRCVALELAPKGVRVNTVNPGPVKTDILKNMDVGNAIESAAWEMMKKATALNRIGDSEEIADVVLFLASDKARSITGASYVSDNGCLLKGSKLV